MTIYVWQCVFCGATVKFGYWNSPKTPRIGMWRYGACPHRCVAPERVGIVHDSRLKLIFIDEKPEYTTSGEKQNEFFDKDWLHCRAICETCVHYDNTQTLGHCCDIDIDTPLRYRGWCGDYEYNPECEEYDPFVENKDYSYLKDEYGVIRIA